MSEVKVKDLRDFLETCDDYDVVMIRYGTHKTMPVEVIKRNIVLSR